MTERRSLLFKSLTEFPLFMLLLMLLMLSLLLLLFSPSLSLSPTFLWNNYRNKTAPAYKAISPSQSGKQRRLVPSGNAGSRERVQSADVSVSVGVADKLTRFSQNDSLLWSRDHTQGLVLWYLTDFNFYRKGEKWRSTIQYISQNKEKIVLFKWELRLNLRSKYIRKFLKYKHMVP